MRPFPPALRLVRSFPVCLLALLVALPAGCGFDVKGLNAIALHGGADVAADPGGAPDNGQEDPGSAEVPTLDAAPEEASGVDTGLDLPPETTLPDDDGDGIPNAQDLCPNRADPTNLDSDGDTAGDACDECPFVEGAGPCTGKWFAAALVGKWMAFRFDPVAGGAPYLRDVVTIDAAGADAFKVRLGVELQSVGAGSIREGGHVWVGLNALPGSTPAAYQGVVSRLGDKLFLQRVDSEGRVLPELLILLRQAKAPGLTQADYLKVHPPSEGEPYVLGGLLVVKGASVDGVASLLQTATFGAFQVNAFPVALSDEAPFASDAIRLLTPDAQGSLTIAPETFAVKVPQADKVTLTVRILTTAGGLLPVPAAVDVPLEGTFSIFGDMGVFVGEKKNINGADAKILMIFLRTFKNPLDPENLNLPFYRLGVADARGAGATLRSSLIDPNGPTKLDVLSLLRGPGAEASLCLSADVDQWSFVETRNPLGHVFRDDCLVSLVDPTAVGAGVAFAYAWMGAVSWGGFPVLPDMGLGLFAPKEDLYKNPAAWPGLVFYAAAPGLGGVFDHYDADIDGSPSGSAKTECDPITLPPVAGGDACPCVVGKEDKSDGCR